MLEVDERLDAHGAVIHPLLVDSVTSLLHDLKQDGADSLAICLLHSHVNDEHERLVEKLAIQAGFTNISRSAIGLFAFLARYKRTLMCGLA